MSPLHPGAELEIGFQRGANVSQKATFDLLVGLFLSLKLRSYDHNLILHGSFFYFSGGHVPPLSPT